MALRLLLAPSIGSARARARAELLERSLGIVFGEPVTILTAEDYDDLAHKARAPLAELVWAPPSICAQLDASVRGMYRCVRNGRSTYRSALIVRRGRDGDLARLLHGKRAIWVDRLSLGGHLLATAYLREQGLEPAELFAEQRFAGSYPEALSEVVYGRADVTAISVPDGAERSVQDALVSFGGRLHADQLAALAVTHETPNDALVLTSCLDEAEAASISARLLGTAPGSTGRPSPSVLMALEADGIEPASLDDYARVRTLLAVPVP